MPRRGWTAIETPCGWFEVIRGPRPPSVQWPCRLHEQRPGEGEGKREAKAWDFQAQSVSRRGVTEAAVEVRLGRPSSPTSQSPSRQSFRGGHRRGAAFGSSLVRVGRRKSTCEAVGGGSSSCPFQGQSPSRGGTNHCVQVLHRTSKEKGDSGPEP